MGDVVLEATSLDFANADDVFSYAIPHAIGFSCYGSSDFDSWGRMSFSEEGVLCDDEGNDKGGNFFSIIREKAWFPLVDGNPQFVVLFRKDSIPFTHSRLSYCWLNSQYSLSESAIREDELCRSDVALHGSFIKCVDRFDTWTRSGALENDIRGLLSIIVESFAFVKNAKLDLQSSDEKTTRNQLNQIDSFPFLSCHDGGSTIVLDNGTSRCEVILEHDQEIECTERILATCALVNGIWSIWSTPCR